jgi:hypothetical protein
MVAQTFVNSTKDFTLSQPLGTLRKGNTPDCPLRIVAYALTPGPWYAVIDTATGRSFGGRYSAREVDYITARFRSWVGPIEPRDFGAVAARAIEVCRVAGQGVAR